MFDWPVLVRQLMEKFGLLNDKDLAKMLGVSAAQISNWRGGRNDLGPMSKLVVLDKLGYDYARQALLAIAPQDRAEKIKKADVERGLKRLAKKPEITHGQSFSVDVQTLKDFGLIDEDASEERQKNLIKSGLPT